MDMLPGRQGESLIGDGTDESLQMEICLQDHGSGRQSWKIDVIPFLLTSFKCTPDSFVIEYSRKSLRTWKTLSDSPA